MWELDRFALTTTLPWQAVETRYESAFPRARSVLEGCGKTLFMIATETFTQAAGR
jgi:hypothetical protein